MNQKLDAIQFVCTRYRETQESISAWAEAVFGSSGSNVRVAARANEEMAELLRAVTADGSTDAIAAECADVVIVLCRLAVRIGLPQEDWLHEPARMHDHRHWSEKNQTYTARQILSIVNRDLADLIRAIEFDDETYIRVNLEEIGGKMLDVFALLGRDLRDEIDKKMAINRAREWKLDGSGHGYHVREKVPEVTLKGPDLGRFDMLWAALESKGRVQTNHREIARLGFAMAVEDFAPHVPGPLIVTIEGPQGSGKTVLARHIQDTVDNVTFHDESPLAQELPRSGIYVQTVQRRRKSEPHIPGRRARREKSMREECPCPEGAIVGQSCMLALGHAGDCLDGAE